VVAEPAVPLADLASRVQALGGVDWGMRMFTTASSGVAGLAEALASTSRAWEGCCRRCASDRAVVVTNGKIG
jgi:hypothetical protein